MGRGLKKSALVTGLAAAVTGLAVSSGVALTSQTPANAAAAAVAAAKVGGSHDSGVKIPARTSALSRSSQRVRIDPRKAKELDQASGGQTTKTKRVAPTDPRDVARAMLPQFGFSQAEFACLDPLWAGESGWNVHADNPTSDAYGIPQALPGSKMATAGSDWANNPATQIRWGLGYIKSSYGTPCGAWSFKQSNGWY
jgi:hypothetical protein